MKKLDIRKEEIILYIRIVRNLQKHISSDDRLDLWASLSEGYCDFCGRKLGKNERCYCQCDD